MPSFILIAMDIHAYKVRKNKIVFERWFTFSDAATTKYITSTLNDVGFEFTEPQIDVSLELIPYCDATDFFGEQIGSWIGLEITKTKTSKDWKKLYENSVD